MGVRGNFLPAHARWGEITQFNGRVVMLVVNHRLVEMNPAVKNYFNVSAETNISDLDDRDKDLRWYLGSRYSYQW